VTDWRRNQEHPVSALPEHDSVAADPPAALPTRNPLEIVWQRKWLVLLGVVLGLVGGVFVQSRRAPLYQSSTQVLVEKKQSDVFQMAGGDPHGTVREDYISTHLVLICSPVIVERAVKKHDLHDLPSFADRDAVSGILGALTATRDSKDTPTNIMTLTFRGPVAEDCPVVLAAVVESYKEFFNAAYQNISDESLQQINKARDLLDKDLKQQKEKYRKFREDCPVVIQPSPKEGMTSSQARLSDLETRRIAQQMRATELEERLQMIEAARKEGNAYEVVAALAARPLDKAAAGNADAMQQLLPLQVQELTLLEDYGPDHPQVKAVRRKIELTRQLLEASAAERKAPGGGDPVEASVKALKQEQMSLKAEQQSLARLIAEEQRQSKSVRSYEDTESELRTDITQTRALLDETIKRLQQLNVIRDFGGYNVQTIAHAGVGGRVSAPAMQSVIAGALVGLLIGIGLAYLADMTDKSFRTPDEIRRRLRLPVLAHVPVLQDERAACNPDGLPIEPSLASYHRPMSVEAEAYRGLRTALYFSTRGEVHKVIQLTSPNMGDGKTTVAANLALAIAQSGKPVVLVDADLRRPRVHSLFGVQPDVGLGSVLTGEAELAAALVPSGVERLSLLPCVERPPNPAELLTLPRFDQVLAELRQQFDFVIVDTPPVLAVTDPCVVAPRMDGVFLVVRLIKNGRPAAERAREILYTLQANVLGVVANAVGKAVGEYGYGYYHYEMHDGGYTPGETNGHAEPAAVGAGANGARPRHRRKTVRWFDRWLR
jgi:capsular exopolysaccharide synthesis family protein